MGKRRDDGKGVDIFHCISHADLVCVHVCLFVSGSNGEGDEFLFRTDITSPVVLGGVMGEHCILLDLSMSIAKLVVHCGLTSLCSAMCT